MKSGWYIVQIIAGNEQKVILEIEQRAKKKHLSDCFEEIIAPSETIAKVNKGKKVNKEQYYFPGYILIKMILTDEVWQLVADIPRVSSILGGGKNRRPIPISETEVKKILEQVEESKEKPKYVLNFCVGEHVRIIDGPFNTFSAKVEEIDLEKERLKVSVSIFGRSTPVTLEFLQVEKMKNESD